MKNLNSISNDELHSLTLTASQNEKSATLILLEHLAEVDHRRLFAIWSCSSLWEYCHKILNYSEAQAYERASATRLMVKVPEVKKELEAGNLSLTTTAKLASHVAREKCAPAETLLLLKSVTGKSKRKVEEVLAGESTSPARPDQVRVVTQELTRITMDVDSDFLELMNRVQELSGHPGSKPQDLFKIMLKEYAKRREVKARAAVHNTPSLRPAEVCRESKAANTQMNDLNLQNEMKGAEGSTTGAQTISRSRCTSKEVKTKIRIRSGDQCEYINPKTGRRCECRTQLQYDHIQPFAQNGANTFENIRHLCAAHNRLAAILSYGKEKMERYFKN